jgi:hypothetical protein
MTVGEIRKNTAEGYIKGILQGTGTASFNPSLLDDQENAKLVENHQIIINNFRKWINSEAGQRHLNTVEKEKQEIKVLMKKLDSLNKESSEFTDLVLYGLLPYAKTKHVMRVSTFPVFFNVKLLFSNYNYNDSDWKQIAKMIYYLTSNFQRDPSQLDNWIKQFTSDEIHSRKFQCGSITPILFCLNDRFPIINNRVIRAFNDFLLILVGMI